jgi:DNA (cytosine-5)-methyltransferase 1
MKHVDSRGLTVLGLFAGVGGIELGLSRAGHRTEMICEIDPAAAAVLKRQLRMTVTPDIRQLRSFPKVDVIAAGFPCQDLSQAGRTVGIVGKQSGLIGEVFQRLEGRRPRPRWLFLENVPFMLQLQRGRAMGYLVEELERLGFAWAYRVVDSRAFGLPQRRRRVILLASRTEDPRSALLSSDSGNMESSASDDAMCGFYWTEGFRGVGWANDAIPPLKAGSSWGIASPPAIWDPLDGSIGTPDIRDAERLQGFKADWTSPANAVPGVRRTHRWKLVGNAVSVPVAEWLGRRLIAPSGEVNETERLSRGHSWPTAAWGYKGAVYRARVSEFPVQTAKASLRDFLRYDRVPLSYKAASGFLARAESGGLSYRPAFLRDLKRYVKHTAVAALG